MFAKNSPVEKTITEKTVDVSGALGNCFFHAYALYLLSNHGKFPEGLFDLNEFDHNDTNLIKLKELFKDKPLQQELTSAESPAYLFEKTLILGVLFRSWFCAQLAKSDPGAFFQAREGLNEHDIRRTTFLQIVSDYKEAIAQDAKAPAHRARILLETVVEEQLKKAQGKVDQGLEELILESIKAMKELEAKPYEQTLKKAQKTLDTVLQKLQELNKEKSDPILNEIEKTLQYDLAKEQYFLTAFKEQTIENSIYLANKEFFNEALLTMDMEKIQEYWNTTGFKKYCEFLSIPGVKVTYADIDPILTQLVNYAIYGQNDAQVVCDKPSPQFELVIEEKGAHYLLRTTPESSELLKHYSAQYENYLKNREAFLKAPSSFSPDGTFFTEATASTSKPIQLLVDKIPEFLSSQQFRAHLLNYLKDPTNSESKKNLILAAAMLYRDAVKSKGLDPYQYMDYLDQIVKPAVQGIKISEDIALTMASWIRELGNAEESEAEAFHALNLAYYEYLDPKNLNKQPSPTSDVKPSIEKQEIPVEYQDLAGKVSDEALRSLIAMPVQENTPKKAYINLLKNIPAGKTLDNKSFELIKKELPNLISANKINPEGIMDPEGGIGLFSSCLNILLKNNITLTKTGVWSWGDYIYYDNLTLLTKLDNKQLQKTHVLLQHLSEKKALDDNTVYYILYNATNLQDKTQDIIGIFEEMAKKNIPLRGVRQPVMNLNQNELLALNLFLSKIDRLERELGKESFKPLIENIKRKHNALLKDEEYFKQITGAINFLLKKEMSLSQTGVTSYFRGNKLNALFDLEVPQLTQINELLTELESYKALTPSSSDYILNNVSSLPNKTKEIQQTFKLMREKQISFEGTVESVMALEKGQIIALNTILEKITSTIPIDPNGFNALVAQVGNTNTTQLNSLEHLTEISKTIDLLLTHKISLTNTARLIWTPNLQALFALSPTQLKEVNVLLKFFADRPPLGEHTVNYILTHGVQLQGIIQEYIDLFRLIEGKNIAIIGIRQPVMNLSSDDRAVLSAFLRKIDHFNITMDKATAKTLIAQVISNKEKIKDVAKGKDYFESVCKIINLINDKKLTLAPNLKTIFQLSSEELEGAYRILTELSKSGALDDRQVTATLKKTLPKKVSQKVTLIFEEMGNKRIPIIGSRQAIRALDENALDALKSILSNMVPQPLDAPLSKAATQLLISEIKTKQQLINTNDEYRDNIIKILNYMTRHKVSFTYSLPYSANLTLLFALDVNQLKEVTKLFDYLAAQYILDDKIGNFIFANGASLQKKIDAILVIFHRMENLGAPLDGLKQSVMELDNNQLDHLDSILQQIEAKHLKMSAAEADALINRIKTNPSEFTKASYRDELANTFILLKETKIKEQNLRFNPSALLLLNEDQLKSAHALLGYLSTKNVLDEDTVDFILKNGGNLKDKAKDIIAVFQLMEDKGILLRGVRQPIMSLTQSQLGFVNTFFTLINNTNERLDANAVKTILDNIKDNEKLSEPDYRQAMGQLINFLLEANVTIGQNDLQRQAFGNKLAPVFKLKTKEIENIEKLCRWFGQDIGNQIADYILSHASTLHEKVDLIEPILEELKKHKDISLVTVSPLIMDLNLQELEIFYFITNKLNQSVEPIKLDENIIQSLVKNIKAHPEVNTEHLNKVIGLLELLAQNKIPFTNVYVPTALWGDNLSKIFQLNETQLSSVLEELREKASFLEADFNNAIKKALTPNTQVDSPLTIPNELTDSLIMDSFVDLGPSMNPSSIEEPVPSSVIQSQKHIDESSIGGSLPPIETVTLTESSDQLESEPKQVLKKDGILLPAKDSIHIEEHDGSVIRESEKDGQLKVEKQVDDTSLSSEHHVSDSLVTHPRTDTSLPASSINQSQENVVSEEVSGQKREEDDTTSLEDSGHSTHDKTLSSSKSVIPPLQVQLEDSEHGARKPVTPPPLVYPTEKWTNDQINNYIQNPQIDWNKDGEKILLKLLAAIGKRNEGILARKTTATHYFNLILGKMTDNHEVIKLVKLIDEKESDNFKYLREERSRWRFHTHGETKTWSSMIGAIKNRLDINVEKTPEAKYTREEYGDFMKIMNEHRGRGFGPVTHSKFYDQLEDLDANQKSVTIKKH
ncbi:hypothetical protein ACTAZI_10875 [Legionella bozemanae]|uniref:hypothetical protein n=1 Tax=Legionella bozemanae TaxID=447 RepID=UPI003EEF6A72